MKLFISIMFILITGVTVAHSVQISSEDVTNSNLDPNVVFVSSGPWLGDSYEHFRVILVNFEIYTTLTVQKVLPSNEEVEGKIFWSRKLDFGYDNMFISPKDFASSFKWDSPTSFSFRSNEKNYSLKNIDQTNPLLEPGT